MNRRNSPRNERGAILMYVLATTLFLGIMATAILSLALTTARATAGHKISGDSARDIDSALEVAVHRVRTAPNTDDSCQPINAHVQGGFRFTCVVRTASGPRMPGVPLDNPNDITLARVVDIQAFRLGVDTAIGSARVRITDYLLDDSNIGYEKYAGYLLEVCDWKLGVRAERESLGGCA